MFILSSSVNTAPHRGEISLKRFSMWKKHVYMPLSEGQWSRFVNRKQGIGSYTMAPHFYSPKATHQGKLWTKTWSDFIHLCKEYPSHIFNQDGNINKVCYLPHDTYIGIVSVPDHPGRIVILVTPPWTHPLRCYYLHLSGAYVCFTTQGRIFCFPEPYFSEQ